MKVFLPGGAGLVGLNLIAYLQKKHKDWEIIVVDKKKNSICIAKQIFKNKRVRFLCEDLTDSKTTLWPKLIQGCEACVMLQAEIGNKDQSLFKRNNVLSTKVILNELKNNKIKRLIHISSSVVQSIANDEYTKTKREQQEIVCKNWDKPLVLSPTLMFGWFDRKHLGWLAKFMKRFPIFPIPGSGEFIRQPLFVQDFCKIIESGLVNNKLNGIYEITCLERIKYISLMDEIKKSVKSRIIFIRLPISLFGVLLQIWSLISFKPAFTKSQLKALTAGDEFNVLDWPNIFNVKATKLKKAIKITFNDKKFSKINIPF